MMAVVSHRIAAVVLAAGASSRFGAPKALATLDGRPILEHVLDAIREAGIGRIVVVLGHHADEIEAGIEWLDEELVRNPDPARLSSSLAVGFAALEDRPSRPDAALVVLGDQPRTRPEVIRRLVAAWRAGDRPVVVPRYADGGGANPVLLASEAFDLVDEAAGDRGLGPVLAEHEDLVEAVDVDGTNPDVDTRADLLALAWGDRVRANREQVDRLREVPDGPDFYAPVTSLFRADPRRTDEPLLDELLGLTEPDDVWLDIGAGAGRYALPLALRVREVVAIDPSGGMLGVLAELAEEAGIRNVTAVEGRWPPAAEGPVARAVAATPVDGTLIAHVGYDIETIGPFLDAIDATARRVAVAAMTERVPASAADPFWPLVHGEARVPLPALGELVELLRARGHDPAVRMFARPAREFGSRDELAGFVRRQLWIADQGEKAQRFATALDELAIEVDGGWTLRDQPAGDLGLVTWQPRRS
jgi:molybdenum cofactor cytidylyltransferase